MKHGFIVIGAAACLILGLSVGFGMGQETCYTDKEYFFTEDELVANNELFREMGKLEATQANFYDCQSKYNLVPKDKVACKPCTCINVSGDCSVERNESYDDGYAECVKAYNQYK